MDLAYELHDLVRTLDKWAHRELSKGGLSYNRYVALVILSEHPGITGRMLSEAIGVSEAAGSGIVRQLLKAGLINNIAVEGDGNIRKLRLTPKGKKTLARTSSYLGSSLDRNAVAIGIDPQELAQTIRAIHNQILKKHSKNSRAESEDKLT